MGGAVRSVFIMVLFMDGIHDALAGVFWNGYWLVLSFSALSVLTMKLVCCCFRFLLGLGLAWSDRSGQELIIGMAGCLGGWWHF